MTAPSDDYGIAGYGSASYGESFADVYDSWYENLDDEDFIAYVASSLPPHDARILELGVGTGRLIAKLLELRKEHADIIVGLDASPLMLNHAERRNFPPRISLVQSDFSHDIPDMKYDAIFVGYNTLFNLPHRSAIARCFALLSDRLAPDGMLHIDAVSPGKNTGGDHIGCKLLANGEKVLSLSSHDIAHQRITGQFIQFDATGHPRYRPWSVHYETPAQLDELAHAAGMRLHCRYGDSVGEPFSETSARHISTYVLGQ